MLRSEIPRDYPAIIRYFTERRINNSEKLEKERERVLFRSR